MRVLLQGATGRLGGEVKAAAAECQIEIIEITRDILKNRIELSGLIQETKCSILDVSLPDGTQTLCDVLANITEEALLSINALVVGTTGHTLALSKKLEVLSQRVPVCVVSNFSRGVFLFEELLQAKTSRGASVADLARSLGFDLALWESHHTKKLDAPSGTGKTLASAAGVSFDRISSSRVGNVVGEHQLFLAGESEELRIGHVAHTRKLFALGALDLIQKMNTTPQLKPGLYNKKEFWGG